MKKYFKTVLVALSAILVSCKGQNGAVKYTSNDDILEIAPKANETKVVSSSKWNGDDGYVCVFFGYGFNGEFYTQASTLLSEKFGLAENGGLVLPVLFPGDLKNRVSNFASIVDDNPIRGIILLGAPDNMHYTLAKIQDEWDGKVPFNVFSFFPQDDVLGHEAGASFVLENISSHSEEIALEEKEQKVDDGILKILENSVEYIAGLPGPLPKDFDLYSHACRIAENRKIMRYVDSETGIQSINHFVLEDAH